MADRSRAIWCRPLRRAPRGLSTLEMVLALPILLLVMALMLNYGTVASWKVRALAVARHEAWANRWPRNSGLAPDPECWPAPGVAGQPGKAAKTLGNSHWGGTIPELADPRLDKPVMRGPLPFGFVVASEVFDPVRGALWGAAQITSDYPLLPKMGQYHLHPRGVILENNWEYHRTHWPQPNGWVDHWWHENVHRRIPDIYQLPKTDPSLPGAFIQTAMAMLTAAYRPDLRPIDDDEEFLYYTAQYLDPLHRPWAPNFIPRLHFRCALDVAAAAQDTENLVDRIQGKVVKDAQGNVIHKIQGVPERMARSFINLYAQVITVLQGLLSATPPPSPDEAAQMQAEISKLQGQMDILTPFLNTFP